MSDNVHDMFVDRGDPAAHDFATANFTKDNAYHNLDLSSIIPVGTKAVLIKLSTLSTDANVYSCFKKGGQTNSINIAECQNYTAGAGYNYMIIVAVDSNRVIQYKFTNNTWSTYNLVVRGLVVINH